MYFSVSSIRSKPLLRISHRLQELLHLFLLILFISLYFESINSLQQFSFFIQHLFQSHLHFLFSEVRVSLYLFDLIESPDFQLLIQYIEVLFLSRMHSPFDFLFVFFFFLSSELFFFLKLLFQHLQFLASQQTSLCSSQHSSDQSLNEKGCFYSPFQPHFTSKVVFRD